MPLCENGIRSWIKLFGGLPRGAGGAFGAAAALVNADVVGAAAARLVMAAVILGTIKIAHKNTSVRTVWAGAGVFMQGYLFKRAAYIRLPLAPP